MLIVFRLRLNGNMPVGREPRLLSTLAKRFLPTKQITMATIPTGDGAKGLNRGKPTPVDIFHRMLGDCTTCTAMCGNGARTGTEIIHKGKDRKVTYTVCCVVDRSTIHRGRCVLPSVRGVFRRTVTTVSAFVRRGLLRLDWDAIQNPRHKQHKEMLEWADPSRRPHCGAYLAAGGTGYAGAAGAAGAGT